MYLSYKMLDQIQSLAVKQKSSYEEILSAALDSYYQDHFSSVNLNNDLDDFIEKNCHHPIATSPPKEFVCKSCTIKWMILWSKHDESGNLQAHGPRIS